MVSRTREKLIEVARQLFAYKGVENTTMGDIATASDKGRRTVYTYFKSKREIYEATIDSESDVVVNDLRRIVADSKNSAERLRGFLHYRLDLFNIRGYKPRGVNIDALLNFDFNRIDKVRQKALSKEKEILREIIKQGVDDGSFNPEQARYLFPVLQLLLQGVDYSIAQNNFSAINVNSDTYKDDIINFIINSLITK